MRVYKQLDEAGSSHWALMEMSGALMKLHEGVLGASSRLPKARTLESPIETHHLMRQKHPTDQNHDINL